MAEILRSPVCRPGLSARAYDGIIRTAALGVRSLSRLLGGGGTSAPGLLVQWLDPSFVARRGLRLPLGVTVVSGTNGKTTTTAMIEAILTASGTTVTANASGSNLFRGVAAALAAAHGNEQAAVFEVDEGALLRLVPALEPRVLVLTNVFRDQLDRFGEPETVADLLASAARALPDGSRVVANADDPLLWHAVEDLAPVGFGVRVSGPAGERGGTDGEPEVCPACGGTTRYRERTISHLGAVVCARCGWSSTEPQVVAEVGRHPRIDALRLSVGGGTADLHLGGIHNAYNVAAAVAATSALGVATADALRALESFTPRFGRTEALEFEGRTLWILLMKNPAGASALVRQVGDDPRIRAAVVALNDRWADGRDVSWIWDADLEPLMRLGVPIVAGGIRAHDVAVRVKYGGGSVAASETDPEAVLRTAVALTEPGDAVAVLATYTAMLALRAEVLGSRRGRVSDVAKEQAGATGRAG